MPDIDEPTESVDLSTIIPGDRRDRIMRLIADRGSVRVAALAEMFNVAEETIRRDLDRLDRTGRVMRTHGGATKIRSDRIDWSMDERQGERAEEKRKIAAAALPFVEPGDVIALDASTTVLRLAALLDDVEIQVVTNGLEAARQLSRRSQVRVTLVGGELGPDSMSLLGPLAHDALERFSFDKVFLSCKAVDPKRGMSEADLPHAEFKRRLIAASERSYLLADHSKFGVRSSAFFGTLGDVDVIVTDSSTDPDFLDGVVARGGDVVIA
ncbi:MAG: DeoR/GlpR family DNA-binding transcription regulator [Planctomycetota bacterium]